MKIFFRFRLMPALLAAFAAGCAPSTREIPAVRDFDLDRYLGSWYEIARLPHRFERGMDFVRAEYTFDGGAVKVVNSGIRDGEPRRIVGRAEFKDPNAKDIGELRVSFFRPFYGDYRIIELDPEYRHAVVTGATKDYLWILSREPEMSASKLAEILGRLEKLGFATDKLEFPRQGRFERHTSSPEAR